MAFYRCGGGGIPSSLKTDMNAVLNKKFGTSADYPPADWAPTVNLMGPLPEKTIVSSPIADFSDGADDVPTKSLIVTIPPTLSGKSEVTETQTGRNLWEFGDVDIDTSQAYVMKYFTYPIPAGTYNLSADITSTTTRCQIRFRKEDGSAITQITLDANNGRVNASFTLTEPAYRAYVYSAMQTSGYMTSWEDVQLEFGSTAHAYEPYQTPTQYTASLGRTIYGGEVDIVNGTGKETYAEIDMGDLTWTYDSTYSRFISSSLPDCIKIDTARTTPILCSAYQVISDGRPISQVPDKSIYLSFHSSGSPLTDAFVHDSDYTDPTAFKTAVTGQKIVYQLKDSAQTDFTFDGQEVPTMLGYNAFWSDEGDTEVTYRADINLALGGQ